MSPQRRIVTDRRPWFQFGPLQIILPHMSRWVTVIPHITIGERRD